MKVGWILFLCSMFASSLLASDFVVAPNDQASQSGNASLLDGFENPSTFQFVYGSKNFSNPVEITGVSFRLNEGSGGLSLSASIPRLTIQISTYFGTFDSFNKLSYDANKGPDDFAAYDGPIHWTTTDLAGSVPNPFDLNIKFSQPFFYNPASGSLLMNYTSFGPFSSSIIADAQGHGDNTIGWIGFQTFGGSVDTATVVTRFEVTSVPEPASIWLAVLGATCLLLRKRN